MLAFSVSYATQGLGADPKYVGLRRRDLRNRDRVAERRRRDRHESRRHGVAHRVPLCLARRPAARGLAGRPLCAVRRTVPTIPAATSLGRSRRDRGPAERSRASAPFSRVERSAVTELMFASLVPNGSKWRATAHAEGPIRAWFVIAAKAHWTNPGASTLQRFARVPHQRVPLSARLKCQNSSTPSSASSGAGGLADALGAMPKLPSICRWMSRSRSIV